MNTQKIVNIKKSFLNFLDKIGYTINDIKELDIALGLGLNVDYPYPYTTIEEALEKVNVEYDLYHTGAFIILSDEIWITSRFNGWELHNIYDDPKELRIKHYITRKKLNKEE